METAVGEAGSKRPGADTVGSEVAGCRWGTGESGQAPPVCSRAVLHACFASPCSRQNGPKRELMALAFAVFVYRKAFSQCFAKDCLRELCGMCSGQQDSNLGPQADKRPLRFLC